MILIDQGIPHRGIYAWCTTPDGVLHGTFLGEAPL